MISASNSIVEKALALWGMAGADYCLVAARENVVYRVSAEQRSCCLRLHRKAYRTDAELCSELQWMHAVRQGGLSVPVPILSISGKSLHVIDGVQVDVLSWLNGSPMGTQTIASGVRDRCGLFNRIGQAMAKLHQLSDAWQRPPDFVRCSWDREGLLGETPLWGRFWDNPTLTPDDRQLFLRVRKMANAQLRQMENQLDFGLIHADLVRENIMIDNKELHLIDFDDGGFGFRLFELATTLLKNKNEPDYPSLRNALLEGYRSVRPIDTSMLSLFMLLRATTYVGWIMSRMDNQESRLRNERFINTARQVAMTYLDQQAGTAAHNYPPE